MNSFKRALMEYLVAPIGAVVVAMAIVAAVAISRDSNQVPFGLAFILIAAVYAYAIGVAMLPLAWLFDKLRWRHWGYYVSAGMVTPPAFFLAFDLLRPWQFYVVTAAAGAVCGLIFHYVNTRQGRWEVSSPL